MTVTDRLDPRCQIHFDAPCDCKAYLVVLGWMDRLLEERIENEPAFAAEVLARLRRVEGQDA